MSGTWLLAASLLLLITGLDAQTSCQFSRTPNSNIFGGNLTTDNNLGGCQMSCQAQQPWCKSIDWDFSTSRCFLLGTQNGKNPGVTGVDHYDYVCNAMGSSPPPPPPPPSHECELTRELYPQTSSLGGYSVPEIPVGSCNAACQRIAACLGYDYGPTGCWFHFNASTFPQKFFQPDVAQLKFNRCPEAGIANCTPTYSGNVIVDVCSSVCYPRFTTWQDTAGSGGQVASSVSSGNVTACLSYCFFQPSCVGVDYSNPPGAPSVCTYYTQWSSLNNSMTVAQVTQYRLEDRCATNCSTSVVNSDNTRYRLYNPSIAPNAASQSACLLACRTSQTCMAYQFNKTAPSSSSCTLADNFFEGSGVNDFNVFSGFYQESCNTPPLPPTPPAPGTCRFYPYANTNIYGGVPNPASNVSGCQEACRSNPSCQGIDWSPGNAAGLQCFLLNKTTDKNSNIQGVIHFDYLCNGSSSTTASGTFLSSTTIVSPSNCWTRYNDTLIYGGTQNPAATLEACWSVCVSQRNPPCMSIDWARVNQVGQQCFILYTQAGKQMNRQGVDHYDYTC